jgi:hypothetical protein
LRRCEVFVGLFSGRCCLIFVVRFFIQNIATISAGFEKGDFLVREEQGNRVYFDFFEEAFNYISNKGYSRMSREDEKHWVDLMNVIHDSVKGGMKYNTGTLLMVLSRPVTEAQIVAAEKMEKPPKKHITPSKPDSAKSLNP